MSLNSRIFIAYFAILSVAFYLLLNTFLAEIKPGYRQSTEDSLVDMANFVAEIVSPDFVAHDTKQLSPQFSDAMQRLLAREYRAEIFGIEKEISKLHIYITDAQGIVRFDSKNKAVGQDYSLWNDVYLTLRGQYGARSTKADINNDLSSVMHVAAPIKHQGKIIGVATVAKPNLSVQPFIEQARKKLISQSLFLVLSAIVLALLFSFWLTRSIRQLSLYSNLIADGKRATLPKLHEVELANLALSMERMRKQLEGKEYVERYIHALTHELKSPISAIKGASELITPDMPADDLVHFMTNIQHETSRIDEMINRLLALAAIEKQQHLTTTENVNLNALIERVIASKEHLSASKNLHIISGSNMTFNIKGDAFLLQQALDNLLQNAIEFSPNNSEINIQINHTACGDIKIDIVDQGTGIPDYALNKIFERFYSLPRPNSAKKSSGLGLCFVKQIMELHNGQISITSPATLGTCATLTFKDHFNH
ncbi:two-component system sensor histidine kinase CreC [Algibacillus agarilyticus]|uniref:two-component system sensor histidine kinase CreC n=1 Tax=Algibacillus agarilyticus TaxID=2234133 RepID=UPI000DD0ADDA|nr:two-component system sensor histidine kinase CreC [Algibacillus agarilyticus]